LREVGGVEFVESLGFLVLVGAAVERGAGGAALEMELSQGVVVAGPPDELPVRARARDVGKAGE
jgi:hypothetical protein